LEVNGSGALVGSGTAVDEGAADVVGAGLEEMGAFFLYSPSSFL
jgi:hypothetical protein